MRKNAIRKKHSWFGDIHFQIIKIVLYIVFIILAILALYQITTINTIEMTFKTEWFASDSLTIEHNIHISTWYKDIDVSSYCKLPELRDYLVEDDDLFNYYLFPKGIPYLEDSSYLRRSYCTIDKRLQKGAMTGIVYWNAPRNIFHSWVEVLYDGKWYELEGFILDAQYLTKLQKLHSDCTGAFCGYGVAVADFQHPSINWNGNNTYIQSEGINQDFGIYSSPDELLKEHRQEMSAIKAFLYRNLGRHLMNRNVKSICANEI